MRFNIVSRVLRSASVIGRGMQCKQLSSTTDAVDDIIDGIERPSSKGKSFAKLFRESAFVELGDFDGRLVAGKIVHRVGTDLYIDFGSKFNAVCKTPEKDRERYLIGSKVLLRLYDTELSERFLGSKNDLTLLEADADLVGLYQKREISSRKESHIL